MTAVKQLGGWRSSTVAEGYVENSFANRQKLYQKLISSVHNAPSTSTAIQTPLPQFEDSRPGKTHEKMSPDILDNDSFILIESNENPEHNHFDSSAAAKPKNIPSIKSSPQINEQISNKNPNAAEIENDDVNDISVYSSFVTWKNIPLRKL
ncbi:hypothetical protein PV327_008735 [Microctonus hyperodae]|uniref:Uncharacterized protein n=1 Tax=Microctonus hyperodae TaxID=165561 RepID=A0AA39FSC5_MICHY|nr:hypothetical protein PV327_008735 [Microctonus hyperodae]